MSSEPDVEAEELIRPIVSSTCSTHGINGSATRWNSISEDTYSLLIGEVDESLIDTNPSAKLFE
ncbi:MAG: hypothetical protein U0Z26_10490 [Anaerolineales bacterium]